MRFFGRVHAYLATIIRDMDSPWVVVGGVADHVHVLFDIGKMVAPAKFVEQLKRESSKFVKTQWKAGTALRLDCLGCGAFQPLTPALTS